jgi:aryl-alcohol dehydrogenase-like predicted oxidoreductase
MDAGVTLLDTGDFYGMGKSEMILAAALRFQREQVVLSVKFGAQRGPDGSWLGYDARPAAVKSWLAYSLKRLGTDYIDIYRPARLDPAVPIEETVGAIAEAVQAGWVRYVGLSEVGADTLRRASAVHPICDVQLEYSLLSRGIESSLLPAARALGIGVTAYGVLSRGLIADSTDTTFAPGDFRAHAPRFQPDNLAENRMLVDRLRPIASRHGLSLAQLAIAWVSARGHDILPVVGTKRRDRLHEALDAVTVELTTEDLAEIDEILPAGSAAGERYAPQQMSHLDSER